MTDNDLAKKQLLSYFEAGQAHASIDSVLESIPVNILGKKIRGLPYTIWQLFEHIRLCQSDLLKYIQNPDYEALIFPDDYWPKNKAPKDEIEWEQSIENFRKDVKRVKALLKNKKTNLFSSVPSNKKHLVFREILRIIDHNAYHLGQLVLLLRLLKVWE